MPVPGGTLTTTTGNWSDLVQTAFDTVAGKYLYERPIFRPFTDKRPTRQSMAARTVTLTITGKLPLATTPLTENLDVDAQAMPANRQLDVTLNEYGDAAVATRLLTKVDFTQDTLMRIGEELGIQASDSIDAVYRAILDGAANVAYVSNEVAAGDPGSVSLTEPDGTATFYSPINSQAIATSKTLLRRRLAMPRFGNMHGCVLHPDVSLDLMSESGPNTWRQPREHVDTSDIYNGHLGDYMGVRFFENTNCTITAGTPDVYNTYFIDKEALVEVVSEDVHSVVADPIDALKRFHRVGWYAVLGVSRYRENAIQLLKSSSSIDGLGLPAYDPKA